MHVASPSPVGARISLIHPELFAPKYWLTWSGIGILRVLELLPYAVQRLLGACVGSLIRRLPLAHTQSARRHIELSFPHLSPEERDALLKRHCEGLGMGLFEISMAWWSSGEHVRRLARVEGAEHLFAALAKGRGAILLGGHFTAIDISTRILGTVVPLNVAYRPPRNALLARVMCRGFSRHAHPIAHDDMRSLVRVLRHNEAVWQAPDQSYRDKQAVTAGFPPPSAATGTSASRLARISGAAVLICFLERLPGNAGYRLHIGEELEA